MLNTVTVRVRNSTPSIRPLCYLYTQEKRKHGVIIPTLNVKSILGAFSTQLQSDRLVQRSQCNFLPQDFLLLPSTLPSSAHRRKRTDPILFFPFCRQLRPSFASRRRRRLARVTERFTIVALRQYRRSKMAAALVAARGAGSAPAWGQEAIAPDWENREVSTGVRKESEFRRCIQGLT
jgi:hypothetical protein